MSQSNYQKERIAWLDEYGMCHKCGKQKKAPNRQFCFDCLEIHRRRDVEKYDPDKAHEYQARRRELYQLHKEKGICVRCSKPATRGLYCLDCSIKAKRQSQEMSRKRKEQRHDRGLIPEYRKENNLCFFCGAKLQNKKHGQACDECAKEMSAHSKMGDKTYWRGLDNLVFKKKTDS